MTELNVKPTGCPVPMERSRERITREGPVPDTLYYRRRILRGELEVVPTRPKLVKPIRREEPEEGGKA